MHAVSPTLLDESDATEHVRSPPRYVSSSSSTGYKDRTVTPQCSVVNIALYCLHDRAPNALRPSPRKVHIAIALLTFACVVFRAELVMFLGPLVLQSLMSGYTTLKNVIKVGLVAGVASVG